MALKRVMVAFCREKGAAVKRRIMSRQFGSTILPRGVCAECGDQCFICGDMTSSCCNAPTTPNLTGDNILEASVTRGKARRSPGVADKARILEEQSNKCFWCGREFGSYIISPKGIIHVLNPVWDHYIPYSYTHSDNVDNFVASCQRCNSHKSAKVILSTEGEEVLREILKRKWYSGGWQDA